MLFNKFKKNYITGLTGWRRGSSIALPVLVLLFWLAVASGLSSSSLAQPADPTGGAPALRGTETSGASGEKTFLTSQERDWLSQHDGRIRIGITVIPPQVLRVEGSYKGLSIDYIRLMERKLGCGFKLVPFATWNEVVQAAQMRRIDMIFAAQQTPERLKYLLFTEPYIELPNMIVVRKDRTGGASLKQMKGWRVATSEGSAVHEYLKREFPDLDPYPVTDELSGLMKVSLGEADAMVVEISRASYYIEKAGILNLRVAGNAGLLYRLRFAVRSDWPVLCGILDKGLAAMTDEERRDITRRWIVVGQKSVFADKAFWIPFAAGLAVIILIVTGAIFWNRTLRRVVRQRTSQLQQELAERRLAQEALRESEEKYRCIVDTASEGILVLGADTLVTFVNARMAEMLGYGAAEMIGRPLTDFMFEADVPDHQEKMAARRKGVSDNYERRLRRKDGGIVRTRVSATPVFDEARRFQGSFGMFTDITNRKQAEDALHRLNRQLRAISTCNQVLMQASDEQTLLDQICGIVCEEAGYRMAWVGYLQNDMDRTIRPVAWAGFEEGYLAEARITGADTERGRGPTGRAIREGVSACIQDFAADPHAAPWRQSALQRGYRSSTALPLKDENGTPFGALCIYSARPGTFTLEEMKLLEELAANLAFGICVLRTRDAQKQSEQELILRERQYRTLLESIPDFIVRYDLDLRLIYVNSAWEKASGLTAVQVLGMAHTDIPGSPGPAAEEYTRKLRIAMETGASQAAEFTWINVHGVKLFLAYIIVPEYDQHGKIVGVLAVGHDITERKEAEEKILRSDQRLRLHSEQSPLGFLEWDDHFCAVEWNAACERIFGYTRDEAIGRHAKDLILPAQVHELVDGIYQSLMNQTGGQRSINENVTKDGRTIVCEWFNTTLINKNGKAIGVASVCRDITKQKRLEEELARHREHLEDQVKERTVELEIARNKARQYLDIAGVILVAIDKDRRVTLINQKGCEVLQSTSAEIIDKDWFETFVPQNQRQEVIRGFEQLMAGELEPVEYFENSVLTQDGRQRLVAWHNVLLRDGQGHITGTLSSGEDITERRHADKQIIHLNQDLQHRAVALETANKELDAFAYTVSHDLRAPLRHIDGFLELLRNEAGTALNEQGRHYMDAISEAANKMGLLIDDLLSFSRMRRHAFSLQEVEMGPLVHDVIRELEPDTAGRTIEWRIGDLPSVNGDERMLRIVLTNLISNALKFTRTRPQARIEIGSLPDQDAESVIFIRDNGVGFDMSYKEKLFGVFQRLHRADDFEGTGIGLASVHRIISRHGGRTWAQGEPDRGAAFYFALPCSLQDRKEGMG